MKKFISLLLAATLILSLSGCSLISKSKIEEGQVHWTLDKDGALTIEMAVNEDDADDDFNIDLGDKEKDIEEDLVDSFDDMDIDVEVKSLKVKNDVLYATLFLEDAEDMGIDMEATFEEYVEDMFYEDIEAYSDSYDFVLYKDGDDIKAKDLEDYADYNVMTIYGNKDGSYITVPGKIEALTDLSFEKISNDTIFVDDKDTGIILYK